MNLMFQGIGNKTLTKKKKKMKNKGYKNNKIKKINGDGRIDK